MLYPPRPGSTASLESEVIRNLDPNEWIYQYKYDGHRVVIAPVNGVLEVFNRYKERKSGVPDDLLADIRAALNPLWTYDGEILPWGVVLWDVLGPNLVGYSYYYRQGILRNNWTLSCPGRVEIADSFPLFGPLAPPDPYTEGYVFKRPEARLEPMFTKENNGSWMIRARFTD